MKTGVTSCRSISFTKSSLELSSHRATVPIAAVELGNDGVEKVSMAGMIKLHTATCAIILSCLNAVGRFERTSKRMEKSTREMFDLTKAEMSFKKLAT